jgi:hypothetical protein
MMAFLTAQIVGWSNYEELESKKGYSIRVQIEPIEVVSVRVQSVIAT